MAVALYTLFTWYNLYEVFWPFAPKVAFTRFWKFSSFLSSEAFTSRLFFTVAFTARLNLSWFYFWKFLVIWMSLAILSFPLCLKWAAVLDASIV